MAYVKTNWQNGVTPVNADNMNKIENELEALDQASGGGGGGASIGGGFTLILKGNINSPIYVLCGNLSYKNGLNENISENWFGWHKITDTYTTATCNNAMCFSVSGTTFKKTGMTNSNNIIDFTGTAVDYSITVNKMYYLIGNLEMTSDD